MAASTTTDFAIPASTACVGASRRRITPQAGRALEILGHAIEYLTDEFVQCGSELSPKNGQLEAVQLLMALNRQVYYECPAVVTVSDRIRSMLHLRAA
ncbi:MAG TPA: hypothetical protein VGG56_04170 [Terracidiphilus sp.]